MHNSFSTVVVALAASVCCVSGGSELRSQSKPQSRPASQPMGWTGVLDEDTFASLHELKQGAAPKLYGRDLRVSGADAYLALPPSGRPRSAVLVIHEWWGLNDNIKHWTDRLAADGHAALAIDLYGGTVATTREAARNAMQSVDSDAALKTLRAAHRFLIENPRIQAERTACIGWCFGGGWSLQLAINEPDLDAAVVYYGRLVNDASQLKKIAASVLGVFGNADRSIPPRAVDAFEASMRAAGKSVEVHRYDANHAFANPSSGRYDKAHAAAAWNQTRAFLRKHLAVRAAGPIPRPEGLDFNAPKGWTKGGKRPMRMLTLKVGADTECYIVVLPGHAGGLEANLNRWREQLGQVALTDDEIEALPTIPVLGGEAKKVEIHGRYIGMRGEDIKDAVMLGAVLPLKDAMLFVKMIGPKSVMQSENANFDAFCASLRATK